MNHADMSSSVSMNNELQGAMRRNAMIRFPIVVGVSLVISVRRRVLLVTAAAILFLVACGDTRISWREEVELQDGTVLIVARTAKTAPFGEIGGPGGWENKGMTLTIVEPPSVDKPPPWDFPFVPMVFDRDAKSDEWFLVATFYSCESWYDLGRPKLPYVEYRVRAGAWQRVPLSSELIGREANVLTDVSSKGEPSLLKLHEKRARMTEPSIAPKYRRIVSSWTTTC